MQQLATWLLTCLLFGQPAPSHEQHGARLVSEQTTAVAAAATPTPPPAGPNDTPPILPLPPH